MKEIISKKKCNNNTLPKHRIVYKIEINDPKSFPENFNELFVNIGPNKDLGHDDLDVDVIPSV